MGVAISVRVTQIGGCPFRCIVAPTLAEAGSGSSADVILA